ncbi:hypothetical protein [Georgenia sp. AZ-5]|uniref:hypothetical protein n=1 Tax=Georgenia sp. AZ-5 TaxID=3367526 RepID=UPI00375513C2
MPRPLLALPARPRTARPVRRPWRAVAGVAVLAATLAGCGAVRLDTPPAEPPRPDAVEVQRQEEAILSAAIADVARITDAGADVAGVLARVAGNAEAHAGALGGVWEPWPGGAPEGARTPEPVETPSATATPEGVLGLLVQGAASAREAALTSTDDDLAAALAAVSLSRADDARRLAAALGVSADLPAGAPLTPEALLTHGPGEATVRLLDSARFAVETVAARTDGAARERAWERAEHLQALVDAALAAGAPDERSAAYDLGLVAQNAAAGPDAEPGADGAMGSHAGADGSGIPDADATANSSESPDDDVAADGFGVGDLTAEQAVAVGAERSLLELWVANIGRTPAGERESVLAAAEHAAVQLRAWGGELPALPGLG